MKTSSFYLYAIFFNLFFLLSGCSTVDETTAPVQTIVPEGILALAETIEPCTAPEWDPDTYYDRKDVVTYNDHQWKAKRGSHGVEPGTNPSMWTDLGPCGDDPGPDPDPDPDPTPIQIYGVWHAGSNYCDWSVERDMEDFDVQNHWLIDRGDGSPSVNLVVLSFVQPMKVLNMTTDDVTLNGLPRGMTQEVIDYFKGPGIRVMLCIGGVTYTDYWDEALATDATQLGLNAAAIASQFGVGIEIDYEKNTDPDLAGLQAFIDAYRSVHPYDASGADHAARLTIDLAAGGRYLIELNRHATTYWLDNDNPVLDYANAMVARASGDPTTWQEHIDGKAQYNPPIPPKAPNRFTGGLYLNGKLANCKDFNSSEQYEHADYVQTVAPNGAGITNGMLGYMFWAAEYPSARKNYAGTVPPNTCEDGMGTGATYFNIPIPMPPLRQE